MKTVLIGAGRSGVGAARLLSLGSDEVTLYNEQSFPEMSELEAIGINVEIASFSLIDIQAYDCIIKAPGVPGFDQAINEVEVAYLNADAYKLYAVSGTNGKTTTTHLLHEMLKQIDQGALATGNIGYALSQAVYDHGNTQRKVALEISAFQMDGLRETQFDIYALMNLSPDHLDRYESVEDYYSAKLSMLQKSKHCIINVDDKNIMERINTTTEYISLSLVGPADIYKKGKSVYFKHEELFQIGDLKLPGKHNLMNAMFAASIAYLAGVTPAQIQDVLHEFKGVEHRLEYIREINGVRFYNDSKATNPESTEVCLKSFDEKIHLIAGGFDKKISFELLGRYKEGLAGVYVYGESAHLLKEVFPNAKIFETMLEASEEAYKMAKENEVVVLSPACASYDQFKNFEERGMIFKQYIKAL
ncbi:UDP-N-acetylmuramoyl-L-alanine--D-glutamate ligase [Erysipelothrix urinaevulpis]|uniref:UDP-N-acetylmuramoyl-L-alanine--D-glutamate ligase n=1 Tax=Erysipelothrix urinaevulpis TaxID=2683717 RepID=UPI0013571CCD|nr:UDP-N-acetylmuramoyl-L-alanine--D-glutamate ligase [Erysipelothrix urinaevulpis]